eukprot:TRINITY_DN2168_c0_g1_i3.p1 TRINITY_DN2168_c0_g1~~TRINITY_DN2168_c0_g1_i3.p1  ORF type:complete len:117 (-),score=2.64 TRINITY_DN2168_c0_g1_i3:362-712(-)
MRGFLGYEPAMSQAAWNNRQCPTVYTVFACLLQQKNLWAKIDRYGFMRPTKGVINLHGEKVDMPYWKWAKKWMNRSSPSLSSFLSSPLSLSSWLALNLVHFLGFHCIPGFTHYLTE